MQTQLTTTRLYLVRAEALDTNQLKGVTRGMSLEQNFVAETCPVALENAARHFPYRFGVPFRIVGIDDRGTVMVRETAVDTRQI